MFVYEFILVKRLFIYCNWIKEDNFIWRLLFGLIVIKFIF